MTRDKQQDGELIPVVAIDASAGGVHTFERLFAQMPNDAGAAYVVVQISDSGPGIPETAMARLFEPFYTIKANGYG